jgi:adenylylsulfate kinase
LIVQIFGLPGSGKTALAKALAKQLNAIHLNADDIRADLSSDLGFSIEDRIEQARRLGAIARLLAGQGHTVVVDFVNPTAKTRAAFGKANYTVWVDRVSFGRFEDTNLLWEIPIEADITIAPGMTIAEEIERIVKHVSTAHSS